MIAELSPNFILWAPIALLILSAIINAIVQHHRRDPCLLFLHQKPVLILNKFKKEYTGDLNVFSNSLEVVHSHPTHTAEPNSKLTSLLYSKNIADIEYLFSPAPKPESPHYEAWKKSILKISTPPPFSKFLRMVRNGFNILRDAFSQAIGMLIGSAKQKTQSLSQINTLENRTSEVSQTLLSTIPNAYEPILELYIGAEVSVEKVYADNRIVEYQGIFEEYTIDFLLIRNCPLSEPLSSSSIPEGYHSEIGDLVFPRSTSFVRHKLAAQHNSPLL